MRGEMRGNMRGETRGREGFKFQVSMYMFVTCHLSLVKLLKACVGLELATLHFESVVKVEY